MLKISQERWSGAPPVLAGSIAAPHGSAPTPGRSREHAMEIWDGKNVMKKNTEIIEKFWGHPLAGYFCWDILAHEKVIPYGNNILGIAKINHHDGLSSMLLTNSWFLLVLCSQYTEYLEIIVSETGNMFLIYHKYTVASK